VAQRVPSVSAKPTIGRCVASSAAKGAQRVGSLCRCGCGKVCTNQRNVYFSRAHAANHRERMKPRPPLCLPDGVLVDDDVRCRLSGSWFFTGRAVTQVRIIGRRRIHQSLHREVLGLKNGGGKIVDHISGNPRDNRLSNLRIVSALENSQNRHKAYSNTGIVGVSFWSERGKYRAHAQLHGRRYRIGDFVRLEDAIAATKRWRKKRMVGFVE